MDTRRANELILFYLVLRNMYAEEKIEQFFFLNNFVCSNTWYVSWIRFFFIQAIANMSFAIKIDREQTKWRIIQSKLINIYICIRTSKVRFVFMGNQQFAIRLTWPVLDQVPIVDSKISLFLQKWAVWAHLLANHPTPYLIWMDCRQQAINMKNKKNNQLISQIEIE